VLELPTIDRFDLILLATMATMHQTPLQGRSDLQLLLINRLHFNLLTQFGQNHRIRSMRINVIRRKR